MPPPNTQSEEDAVNSSVSAEMLTSEELLRYVGRHHSQPRDKSPSVQETWPDIRGLPKALSKESMAEESCHCSFWGGGGG